MKTKLFLSLLMIILVISAYGQKPSLELRFTAVDNAEYVQLDSIKVMNKTQGGDTVIYYPDTILVLDYQLSISETDNESNGFHIIQNYPNPVTDYTTISFYVPEKDNISVVLSDIKGGRLKKIERILDKGFHSYLLNPGNGKLFILSVQWRNMKRSIKILKTGLGSNKKCIIEYEGSMNSPQEVKEYKTVQDLPYTPGDRLLFVGYYDTLQSGILDAPVENQDYAFQFAYNITCPGTPTVEYEGQIYNTVQIFNQCWLKENLNVGTMIPGTQNMTNNGIIEKYCYNNQEVNCNTGGGLYLWNELMTYSTEEGIQGICPPGWHIPTDEETKLLEGVMDSEYGIGDPEWDTITWRGFDAGLNIKSSISWNSGGNGTDKYGFTALPSGYRSWNSDFYFWGFETDFWSSTEFSGSNAWRRELRYNHDEMSRNERSKQYAFSCRCIKD